MTVHLATGGVEALKESLEVCAIVYCILHFSFRIVKGPGHMFGGATFIITTPLVFTVIKNQRPTVPFAVLISTMINQLRRSVANLFCCV
jgi:hypothetical protein